MKHQGLITSSYGRMYKVLVGDTYYHGVTKAKKSDYVVGDYVLVDIINQEQAQITDLIPRNSLIYRSDRYKSKQIASNVDQIIVVTSVTPNYNLDFISNSLIFAESECISVLLVVNKSLLNESKEYIALINELYGSIGYLVVTLNGIDSVDALIPLIKNKTNVLIGQSGVGKSTITNQLLQKKSAKTNDIMKSHNSGKHTTTNANLYFIDNETKIIDCPGLQEFGLYHLEHDRLIEYFPEFKKYIGQCKFANCKHIEEPNCIIRELFTNNLVSKYRYEYYVRLYTSLRPIIK